MSSPRVSIGLPVFNGEAYLEAALESISTQTFEDLEIIICDNASTDGTRAICEAWQKRDTRIRYVRSDSNHGAAYNFNRAFELSRGEYFKWAAYDDVISANFIERCVEVLDASPEAVVAYTPSVFIDETGAVIKHRKEEFQLASNCPSRRFWQMVAHMGHCIPVFGVIRSSALARTRLIGAFPHADRVTLLELSLLGQFREAEDALFYLRKHARSSLAANRTNEALMRWYDTHTRAKPRHQMIRLTLEKFRSVNRSDVPTLHKAACHARVVLFGAGWVTPTVARKLTRFIHRQPLGVARS